MFLQIDSSRRSRKDRVDLSLSSLSVGIGRLKGLNTGSLCCHDSSHSCNQIDTVLRERHVIVPSFKGDDARHWWR